MKRIPPSFVVSLIYYPKIINLLSPVVVPVWHGTGLSSKQLRLRSIKFKEKGFSLLRNVQSGSGNQTGYYSVSTRFLSCGKNGRGVKLINYLHLVPSLIMNGVIPLLFLYAFLAWTRKTLLSSFLYPLVLRGICG